MVSHMGSKIANKAGMRILGVLGLYMLAGVCSLTAQVQTSTTISSSLNPSVYGQSITFTAVVNSVNGPPPDGETITFKKNSTVVLGTASLSGGTAVLKTSTIGAGSPSIIAVYAGDSQFAHSTSQTLTQVVQQASTTTSLTSSENPANVYQGVTFTATVKPQYSGTVTGSVVFFNGTTKLKTVQLSGGVASFTKTFQQGGTNSITASYNGSTNFIASSSNVLSQVIGTGQYINAQMVWDGVTRYYQIFVPTVLAAHPAMLLMLHGTRLTSTLTPQVVTSINWGWSNLADQYGFIEVQPASTWDPVSTAWNWNSYYLDASFPPPAPDDSGFLRQLIVNLTAQYNVDPKQVYVAGSSSGGQMAQRVAVEISDLVAAVVTASGQAVGQTAPPPITMPGPPKAPISVQEWHGTLDTVLPPCNNGTTNYSGVNYYLPTVDDDFNYWAQENGCSQLQNNIPLCLGGSPNPNTTGNIATACSNNVEEQFIWEENTGHLWVSSYNGQRWQFFASHAKP